MRIQLEVGIFDQHGGGQAEGKRNEAPPERWELVKPVGEVPAQVLQSEETPVRDRSSPRAMICIGCPGISRLRKSASSPLSRRTRIAALPTVNRSFGISASIAASVTDSSQSITVCNRNVVPRRALAAQVRTVRSAAGRHRCPYIVVSFWRLPPP
jgi:hypothetical protein